MPPTDSSELDKLVHQASENAALDDARRRTRIERTGIFRRRVLPALVMLAMLTSVIWALEAMWHHFAPHSEEKVVRDLTKIIEQARRSIESARAGSGYLPASLPNASLASVVFYDYSGNGYRLFAEYGDLRVTLNPDGRTVVEKTENK